MCERVPETKTFILDDVLEHFGFERREEGARHDAREDCTLSAKVYMELMKHPPLKVAELGFDYQEE